MPSPGVTSPPTTAGTGHPRLHPVHGGHLYAGEAVLAPWRLREVRTVFGSDPSCDVVVPTLAARHFSLVRDDEDRYVVQPLEGTVSVNGRSGPALTLHTGDVVRCGRWAASFARDPSTDQIRGRTQRYLDPHGVLGHLEYWAFLLYGSSSLAPVHRFPERPAPKRRSPAA